MPAGPWSVALRLNFPEYAGASQDWRVTRCDWDVFGEVAPFGSQERRILHAERAICASPDEAPTDMMVLGSVVVHVALDYQALPFISSQSPYIEALRQTLPAPEVGQTGHDVELVVYGWGLQPIFTSGQSAWLLDDALFDRLYESREPFWVTRSKSEVGYNVYLVNNRAGIYALGYPVAVMFDHLVRLAETTTLVGLLFVSLVLITTAAGVLAPNRYRFGRALLREVRTSFYRRLFLAFVAATVIPVLALALVMRNYFTTQLRAGSSDRNLPRDDQRRSWLFPFPMVVLHPTIGTTVVSTPNSGAVPFVTGCRGSFLGGGPDTPLVAR